MRFEECVASIIEMDGEAKAIQLLSATLLSKWKRVNDRLAGCEAALRAIRKLNEAKDNLDWVSALTDLDEIDEAMRERNDGNDSVSEQSGG